MESIFTNRSTYPVRPLAPLNTSLVATRRKVCSVSVDVGRTGARQCALSAARCRGRAGQRGESGGKRQREGERKFKDEYFMALCHATKIPLIILKDCFRIHFCKQTKKVRKYFKKTLLIVNPDL